MQFVDLRLTPRQIEFARRLIRLLLVLAQRLDRLVELRALVECAEHAHRDRHRRVAQRPADGEGDHEAIDRRSDQIAHRRRPDQRHIQKRAGLYPVKAERVGKAIGILSQLEGFAPRHVENAADADGGVDQEAPDRLGGPADLVLQDAVECGDGLAQIVEHVADPVAHRRGQDLLIGLGDRADHRDIDRLGDLETLQIDALQRVAGTARARGDDQILGSGLGWAGLRCGG